jgi:Tol biopolymer transport system component
MLTNFVHNAIILGLLISAMTANAQPVVAPPQVVERVEPPYELWTIDAAGGAAERFAETPGYTCGSPDWSPDGKFVAYDTWPIGGTFSDSKIAVIRADGSDLKIIGDGGMASWSPDGKQLACHTYDNPQTIVVMNADGSGRETVIHHWGSPRWMPRGNRIASLNVNREILMLDLTTGNERSIVGGPRSSQIGFGVSPDGLRICFGHNDGGISVVTMDEDGGVATVRPLANPRWGAARHCSWSPDGKRIVAGWRSAGQELEQLFIFDLDTNEPPKSLKGQDPWRNNACPDWSPDGKTIIFVSQDPMAKPEMEE